MKRTYLPVLCTILACSQIPIPAQTRQEPQTPVGGMPIYRVTVVQRTTTAISYRHRSGWTKVDFRGTPLAPEAKGQANVNSRKGYIEIEAKMERLQPASRFGPEYLTYVMWAITPEGRATNLGEVLLSGDDAKLDVTTELQAFGLIVTAEPYFGVTQPSDVVVMENFVRADTVGKFEQVNAKYELLKRGQYTLNVAPQQLRPIAMDSRTPLELYEARNAVQIARWAGADRYASDTFQQANQLLAQAENYQARKAGMKPVQMTSREAVQKSEDARLIAVRRQEEERLAQERQAAAEREASAKAAADEASRQQQLEAQRRAQAEAEKLKADAERLKAEAERTKAESDRAAAERAKAEAEAAVQRAATERAAADQARLAAERAKAEADAARQQLQVEADKARQQASDADRLRQDADRLRQDADRARQAAEADRDRVRQQLLQQLNMVLETRETARGLIVNMSDVLFDTGRYTLKPGAREKLSKIAGIVLAHPGLNLEVEGHTDNVGGDEYNQKLSEQRATSVRDYLAQQGLSGNSITARGFGKTQPVASNANAAGRQQNRRVELVVSGDVIGTKIQSMRLNGTTQPPRQ